MAISDYTSKDIARFWSKVNKDGSIPAHCPELGQCWEWTACKVNAYGYGAFRVNGKTLRSHRVAYELIFGETPEKMKVLHKCDNPKCCNPSHLFLGTQINNIQDMVSKGRQKGAPGERRRNHKLTTSQVQSIREQYAAGGITYQQLADKFGVVSRHVSDIVRGKKWKHTIAAEE